MTNGGTAVDQVVGISCGVGCSVNNEDSASSRGSVGRSTSLPFTHRATLRPEFARSDLFLSETPNDCGELFAGPVKGSHTLCPVSVEFEGM